MQVEALEKWGPRLVDAFDAAVRRRRVDAILFSGGLDTSVIGVLAKRHHDPLGITVAFNGGTPLDPEWARRVADALLLRHLLYSFDRRELQEATDAVIKILRTFDPMEVRNSASIYIALRLAAAMGAKAVCTGDAMDELFGGYGFLFEMPPEKAQARMEEIWRSMRFTSVDLGRHLGIEVLIPSLDDDVVALAKEIHVDYKIREEDGTTVGKWIVRKAFEGLLPHEVLWRPKAPIEGGSGTSILPQLASESLADEAFEAERQEILQRDDVAIRDKEQLLYYRRYHAEFGSPPQGDGSGATCPWCKTTVPPSSNYCATCGGYPVRG